MLERREEREQRTLLVEQAAVEPLDVIDAEIAAGGHGGKPLADPRMRGRVDTVRTSCNAVVHTPGAIERWQSLKHPRLLEEPRQST